MPNVKTYPRGASVQLSKNFKSREFDCNGYGCCTMTMVDQDLVDILQKIRDHFGRPLNISSGYRCEEHNEKVGGAKKSNHKKGMAADIWVDGYLHNPRAVAQYAESIGVKGIGLYEGSKGQYFVHIDTRTTKCFWEGHEELIVKTFFDEGQDDKEYQLTLRVLKKGCKGEDVRALQELLIAAGYTMGSYGADGSFGAMTENAVEAYQEDAGLSVDGHVGPATMAHILGRG